jgi:hypothetical protein
MYIADMRIRIVDRTQAKKQRDGEMRLRPAEPIRSLEECAEIMGLTMEQAMFHHTSAIQKLSKALSGYRTEFRKGRSRS